MLRGISLQVKLALYQLRHVLISCLISESPSTVTDPLISGLKRLSRRTDHPSEPINRSFSLSGLRHLVHQMHPCCKLCMGSIRT